MSEDIGTGQREHFFNINAADPKKMEDALEEMKGLLGGGEDIEVLMHSLAFGTLRPYVGEGSVSSSQMDMTLRVMAHSLVDWTQAAVRWGMLGGGSFSLFPKKPLDHGERHQRGWRGRGRSPVVALEPVREMECGRLHP